MKKIYLKIRLAGFYLKALFSTTFMRFSGKEAEQQVVAWKEYSNTVQDFLSKYDVNKEDKVDYTNTHKHHHENFKHLDDPNNPEFKDEKGGDRVLERVGLIYEADGKTPLNVADCFDMTFEEYRLYKEKILPQAIDRKIPYWEIQKFINAERGVVMKPKKKKYYKPKPKKDGDKK